MKIAVRCLYHKPVMPNFLIVDLADDEWKRFLGADKYEKIRLIRSFIKKPGPSDIREITWIALHGLTDREMVELELACKALMSEEYRGLQFKKKDDEK